MRKLTVVLAAVVASALLAGPAGAAAQMSAKDYRAALAACKKEANPKKRDECVSNAKNRYEKGKGAQHQATDATKDMKGKAKSGSDATTKGATEKMKK
jgi:curli biogenesis system outer membrane secretion channel CsgG